MFEFICVVATDERLRDQWNCGCPLAHCLESLSGFVFDSGTIGVQCERLLRKNETLAGVANRCVIIRQGGEECRVPGMFDALCLFQFDGLMKCLGSQIALCA